MMREIPTAISAKYQLAMNMMDTQQIAPRIDRDLQVIGVSFLYLYQLQLLPMIEFEAWPPVGCLEQGK